MKLIDALELLRLPVPDDAPGLKIFLACGFTPLHLQTFLAAQLRKLIPQQNIEIKTGIFGDLVGNIERLSPSDFNSLIVIIEWGDLDPAWVAGVRRISTTSVILRSRLRFDWKRLCSKFHDLSQLSFACQPSPYLQCLGRHQLRHQLLRCKSILSLRRSRSHCLDGRGCAS